MTASGYHPVRVQARLDEHLSRWRWLVKWLLAIPHYVVLALLWMAFAVLSVYAFFAILITGRYPRAVFDFNVGVLRWTWRVHYYSFGALATDRYPPFTLEDVPDYPARLEIDYPAHLSRGLVLVKWWLLALPHYLVIGLFLGGGWLAWRADGRYAGAPGLIGLLALFAAVALLFTGRYPRPIFDFVLGLNRWVLRVAAYAALMTDDYPPFRLDPGGSEPGATLVIPPGPAAAAPGAEAPVAEAPVSLAKPASSAGPAAARRGGWTGLRITGVVIGSILVLVGLGGLAAGSAATWFDHHRDGGYVTSGPATRHTAGYAITSDRITFGTGFVESGWARDLLGTVRVRVSGGQPVFVGIAPSSAVDGYLRGVPRTVLHDLGSARGSTVRGTVPPAAPTASRIWVASAAGPGEQTVVWTPRAGDWTVVVMNADASTGVSVTGDVGATFPSLGWVAVGSFIGAGIVLVLAAVLLIVPIRRASRPAAEPAPRP